MDLKPQVPTEHYNNLVYDSKDRFISYWHQINQIVKRSPEDVMEVGIGNGFLCRYLKWMEIPIHTCDFDPELEPDTVGSILELPFEDDQFDMSCCFETLEHLPWDVFDTALAELARVSRRWVLLSLPDVTPYVQANLVVGFRTKIFKIFRDTPNPKPTNHTFNGEHYWEVGKTGYPLELIKERLDANGLVLEETLRVEENPFHRFLSCRVR